MDVERKEVLFQVLRAMTEMRKQRMKFDEMSKAMSRVEV